MNVLAVSTLAEPLLAALANNTQRFIEHNPEQADWLHQLRQQQPFADQLARTWLGSQYAADVCIQQPQMLRQLVEQGLLEQRYDEGQMGSHLAALLADVTTAEQLDPLLRQHRAQEMLRIIWRDLNRLADMQETTRDISQLAECCIQQALAFHHRQLAKLYGKPCAKLDGQWVEQTMHVIGMGKLGAMELNLSSDIDLIFAYPHRGETQPDPDLVKQKILDNSEFFTRVARKLIQSLDQFTVDGFVFRVDMRLRPYGQSGALVLSFSALEEYYQSQGRDWERYAMIKARVVAGEPDTSQQLMDLLRPFTYRRYIDFSAVESLRSMKQMIMQEVKRRRLDNDVKLGPGGIRDIEFIAQCFQLIRGGRELDLQERRVQTVLGLLADKAYLPADSVAELQQAYIFLRNTEHALQAFKDQQTQALPVDDLPQAALAFVMGFPSWQLFSEALQQHRLHVSRLFHDMISEQETDKAEDAVAQVWIDLWRDSNSEQAQLEALQQAGHENGEAVLKRIKQLRDDSAVKRMQTVGQQRLDQFIPLLLQAVISAEQPSSTLLRILPLIEAVLRRTAYLLLLVENPLGLQQLVILCAGSPWIAAQLARYPVLLDELLDVRTLYQVPDKQALRAELQQQMLRVQWNDLDAHMEGLRYFKQAHQLQVSAAEVTGKLPLMKVSDYLTIVAEVILEHVLDVAWYNLTEKHGYPQLSPGVPCEKNFIIVGYGKLGGIELNHSSDLDLVFIHDAATNMPTDGERPVDNTVFFTRLGQRIIHILTAQTPSGMLYDVDMRLRPSGNSGLLVSPLHAFENYQEKDAWTWEHQALVRARVVAGSAELAGKFETLRRQVLCQPRDEVALKTEVLAMRKKMRDHLLPKGLDQSDPPFFHLKHSRGAIVDIEFMVQYAVLAWSHQYSALAVYTDNIRILESLRDEGLFSDSETETLIEAYKVYRVATHRLSLLQHSSEVALADVEQHSKPVTAKWSSLLGEDV
jgi:glutamate-ammonia-ligase adenylyltransferase